MKYYFNILLFVLVGCSSAQKPPTEPAFQRVVPGDPVLVPERIRPHKVKYKKTGGKMTYIMKEVTKNGQDAYELAVYYNVDESTGTPDLMYFAKQTLGYVGRRMEMEAYTLDVNFSGNNFNGQLTPTTNSKYSPISYDKDYPHNAFEPAIINYFIAALPLKEGYKASVPVFDLNQGSQMYWSNIEVLKREKVKLNGKSYETWKVVSKGIKEKTIWVTTTEPYAIKMKTKGAGGTWELAE